MFPLAKHKTPYRNLWYITNTTPWRTEPHLLRVLPLDWPLGYAFRSPPLHSGTPTLLDWTVFYSHSLGFIWFLQRSDWKNRTERWRWPPTLHPLSFNGDSNSHSPISDVIIGFHLLGWLGCSFRAFLHWWVLPTGLETKMRLLPLLNMSVPNVQY